MTHEANSQQALRSNVCFIVARKAAGNPGKDTKHQRSTRERRTEKTHAA
jgi:hypothetical protein